MQRDTAISFAIIAAFGVMSFFTYIDTPSPDLLATWLAGRFFGLGELAQIYPSDTTFFTLLPPETWVAYQIEHGQTGTLYPYIYPPLWAALASYLPEGGYPIFKAIFGALNPVLMGLMFWLAARASRVSFPLWMFCAVGLVTQVVSVMGAVALIQNQPQIIVSFLIVLAIERSRANAPVGAGIALALAAALKVYPVLLVIFWLAGRQYRTVGVFALAGALLGGLSIALAGWPLHALFLDQIAVINRSIMGTLVSFNLDTIFARLFWFDNLTHIYGVEVDPDFVHDSGGWYVMAKPPLWRALSTAALLATLAAVAWAMRKTRSADVLLWPAALIAIAMVSPLSWTYHYLPAAAFAPALLDRFGRSTGTIIIMACFAPLSLAIFTKINFGLTAETGKPLTGMLCMLALMLAYLVAARRPQPTKSA